MKADPYSILILFFGIVTNMNEFVIYFFSVKLILLAFHFHSAQICKKFFLCCENVFIPFVMLLFVLSHILRVTWHQMQIYSISISMNRETQEKYVTIWQRHRQKKILVKAQNKPSSIVGNVWKPLKKEHNPWNDTRQYEVVKVIHILFLQKLDYEYVLIIDLNLLGFHLLVG